MSVRLSTLPNGLRVVTETMPGLGSASVGVWVGAGGRHERDDQTGIAHFLEHMAFKGTARRSARQIVEEIEDVGGQINAYTSRETTAYFARVLAEDVPRALDVIADILRAPALAENEIEIERGVILQEIGQALDTPDDIVFDWLQEVCYPGQAMGRSILGPAERVRAFRQPDFRAFLAEHYVPGAMILAAAGAVDHDQILGLAERLFGDMAALPVPGVEPARFMGGERRELRPLEQVHLTLAFEAPDYRAPDFYAAQVQATALGGGMSSRLFQELRERLGLCYSVFASAGAYADSGTMTIYAGTSAEDADRLATRIMAELARAAEGMAEAEIARARAQLRAGLLMGLESPGARCERIARMVSIWGRVPDPAEALAAIDAVTAADVRAVSERYATTPAMALAVTGPAEGLRPHADLLACRLA